MKAKHNVRQSATSVQFQVKCQATTWKNEKEVCRHKSQKKKFVENVGRKKRLYAQVSHMDPENYGLFQVHFLPIFWPHYSLFIREKLYKYR